MGRALRNIVFHRELTILVFLVIVSSVFSRKHNSMSSSQAASPATSAEKDGGQTMLAQETEDEPMGTHLGTASDLQSAASKYSAKYSAANSPYVSSSDIGEYYAYHHPTHTYAKSYGGSGKSPSSGSSSYYYNPLVDSSYPHYYPHERTAREFSTRQSAPSPIYASPDHLGPPEFPPLMVPASPPPPHPNSYYNFVDVGPDYAEYALASGGHGGGGGSGWGWKGKGHGWVNQYVSKVNTDAIGLLGLLGLLSLLSNVLLLFTTTTTTTPAGRRKKRSPDNTPEKHDWEKGLETAHRLTTQVLPSLTLVAHARSGRLPLNCTHLEVCKTNRIIVNELGFMGRPIGSRLSVAISKLLHQVDRTGAILGHVDKAGIAGRNGKNCEEMYPVCNALSGNERTVLPILIRLKDIPNIMQGKYPVNPKYIPKF